MLVPPNFFINYRVTVSLSRVDINKNRKQGTVNSKQENMKHEVPEKASGRFLREGITGKIKQRNCKLVFVL